MGEEGWGAGGWGAGWGYTNMLICAVNQSVQLIDVVKNMYNPIHCLPSFIGIYQIFSEILQIALSAFLACKLF